MTINLHAGQYSELALRFLCNEGSLYAPYSLLSISNMLCGGGGGQGGKVSGTNDPVKRNVGLFWKNCAAYF
jgi:hypothetical protein